MAGAIAAYLAAYNTHPLAPGETGSVLALAVNKDQAGAVLDYAAAFLRASPILRQMVDREPTADEIRLGNNVVIGAVPANFRTVRSRTMIGAVFDECSFWRDSESSLNPDTEIYSATLPSLATAGGLLVGISSPYRRAGLLFTKFERYYGRDDPDVLVLRAPSMLLNPTIKADVVERARAMDPERARSEWDAEFRNDISDFIDRAAIMACVDQGVRERRPERQHRYVAAVDPSGGGQDSFALGIGHKEGVTSVLDCIREVRPGGGAFNPESIVSEFATLLRTYRVSTVTGDKFAGEWPAAEFRKHGIHYEPADRTKSDYYRDALPLINSGAVALLEHERLINQLTALERRVARGGKDSVDHPPGGHDDVANVGAAVLVLASAKRARMPGDRDGSYIADIRSPLAEEHYGGDRQSSYDPLTGY
jgi:hypothetical protein